MIVVLSTGVGSLAIVVSYAGVGSEARHSAATADVMWLSAVAQAAPASFATVAVGSV